MTAITINGIIVEMPPGRVAPWDTKHIKKPSRVWGKSKKAVVLKELIAFVEEHGKAPATGSALGYRVKRAWKTTPWRLYCRWQAGELQQG